MENDITQCTECGTSYHLFEHEDRHICRDCLSKTKTGLKKFPQTVQAAESAGRRFRRSGLSFDEMMDLIREQYTFGHTNTRAALKRGYKNEDRILGPNHSCY